MIAPINPLFSLITLQSHILTLNQTRSASHTYTKAGTYTVEIWGDFPRIHFGNWRSNDKIISIEQWGTITWLSMNGAFHGCRSLVINATDAPDLSQVTDMSYMFQGATAFDSDISHWDVSRVTTDMNGMFREATAFNQSLSAWNVSRVIHMSQTFQEASSFNQDLSGWNVSSVTDMSYMFQGATAFDQDLSDWNVYKHTNTNYMFKGTPIKTKGVFPSWCSGKCRQGGSGE